MGRRLTWLDVFTSQPYTGNALAVVHDADGLGDDEMLAIARETNLSETTFIQSPTQPGADYRNRIFTLTGELPFAGHPSLGTAVAVARERGEAHASYVQETRAGLQPLEVALDGPVARVSMLQEPAVFAEELDTGETLAAAGLDPADGHPELRPQVVATGARQLLVPVRDAAVLDRVDPDVQRMVAMVRALGTIVFYLFAPDGERVQARSFLPVPAGLVEDPATGAAAGPLCAYLAHYTGAPAVTIEQGVAMGRPAQMRAAVEGDRVRVSGDVVVVLDGALL